MNLCFGKDCFGKDCFDIGFFCKPFGETLSWIRKKINVKKQIIVIIKPTRPFHHAQSRKAFGWLERPWTDITPNVADRNDTKQI